MAQGDRAVRAHGSPPPLLAQHAGHDDRVEKVLFRLDAFDLKSPIDRHNPERVLRFDMKFLLDELFRAEIDLLLADAFGDAGVAGRAEGIDRF